MSLTRGIQTKKSIAATRCAIGRKRPVLVLGILGLAAVSACTRPTGDFGRAEPSELHDNLLPGFGKALRYTTQQTVSTFNLTDDEKELRNRAWALIAPPSSSDWIGITTTELRRTGILPEKYLWIDPEKYYEVLRSEKYRSSETRYNRIVRDMESDRTLIAPYCEVARRVAAADKERRLALERRPAPTSDDVAGVYARLEENDDVTRWVLGMATIRLKAYRHAKNTLELETPSQEKIWSANHAYNALTQEYIMLFEDCGLEQGQDVVAEGPLKSRILQGWGQESPPPQK